MDVFISHSSADSELAARVEKSLEGDGLEAWLDRSEIRPGSLLRDELQTQIKRSRAVALLGRGLPPASHLAPERRKKLFEKAPERGGRI